MPIKLKRCIIKICKTYVNRLFPAHLVMCYFLIHISTPSSIFWPPMIFTFWYCELEKPVWNDSQKMDEGVKISKSNIWPNVQDMADLHSESAFLKFELCTIILLAIQVIFYLLRAGRTVYIFFCDLITLRPCFAAICLSENLFLSFQN